MGEIKIVSVNVPRDPDEFEEHLVVQHGFLETSARAFDRGQQSEAIRLATTLRVLVHDTGTSVSLLTHLGQKDSLPILDTAAGASPSNGYGPWTPLLDLNIHGPPVFVPRFLHDSTILRASEAKASEPGWLSVDSWLDRIVIREPRAGNEFSTRDLILHLANKDGGAHVDPELPTDYHHLSRLNSLEVSYGYLPWGGKSISTGDGGLSVGHDAESPVPATVRQLAFEMMWGLHRTFGLDRPVSELDVHHRGMFSPMR